MNFDATSAATRPSRSYAKPTLTRGPRLSQVVAVELGSRRPD
jgi:hypothetical protein